jgi:putative tryptophan/tyrosine transport system substrate-binding protein
LEPAYNAGVRRHGMTRRDLVAALGLAIAGPRVARARAALPVIGFLSSGLPDEFRHLVAAVHQGLAEKGYVAGRTVLIAYRWAEGHHDRLPSLANDLVEHRVDVIISSGGIVAARAAKAATKKIPIVFASGDDPVRFGIVASLNHPGGNVTGVTISSSALLAKRLEIMAELLPNSHSLALLVNPSNPDAEANAKDAQNAAKSLRQVLIVEKAATAAELDAVFADLRTRGANALLVTTDPFLNGMRQHIARSAVQNLIALISDFREYVEAGGLMSYGASIVAVYRQLGSYAGRVLDGDKPGELPVQAPTKFEFFLNLKTAKVLGLTIPPTLLARADEVIE